MLLDERQLRRLINTKQSTVEFKGVPSVNTMAEGQVAIHKESNSQIALYRKKNGKLYKSYMSSDGSLLIDKSLKAKRLEYTSTFIDYRVFAHNFSDDLPATKIYVPWVSGREGTSLLTAENSFLTPYNMSCHKIVFRTPALDTAATDIVFSIEKVDSGDVTTDSVCTFDATATWSDNTNFTINKGDWSAKPAVGAGDVVAIGIQADNTNIVTSDKNFHMTSVWEVEVKI
tara:strand:+ start:81 stop:767 length:687 start_codon:yes stop_codon:yes gene_type:complete